MAGRRWCADFWGGLCPPIDPLGSWRPLRLSVPPRFKPLSPYAVFSPLSILAPDQLPTFARAHEKKARSQRVEAKRRDTRFRLAGKDGSWVAGRAGTDGGRANGWQKGGQARPRERKSLRIHGRASARVHVHASRHTHTAARTDPNFSRHSGQLCHPHVSCSLETPKFRANSSREGSRP